MKKIILTVVSLILSVVCLSGCAGVGGQQLPGISTEKAPDPASIKASDYKNNLAEMEKYLVALGYIPSEAKPTEMMYSVIGAKAGDRFVFSVDDVPAYVELYEYDTEKMDSNEEGKRVTGEVKKDGKYYVFGEDGIGGDVAIEASLSDNGKYLVSYTLGGNKDTVVQRKKDFIKAVKEYYK